MNDTLLKQTYTLENLGCANCAAKMESKINDLPEVISATITFPTKQLRLEGGDPASLLPKLQTICASIESEVKVVPKETSATSGHNHGASESTKDHTLLWILSGAFLFLAGILLERQPLSPAVSLIVFLAAYILLGGKIVLTALKNLFKGQIFDENFLMSIATLGAIAIRDYPEAVGVMLFFRVGEYFEDKAVEKSRAQIMDAIDMRPEVVQRLHGPHVHTIPASEALPGDLLLVRPGDRIPLDSIIVEGESRIDTSAVTGEPVPVFAGPGSSVISGCVNTSGQLTIKVEKPLEDSMVSRILDAVENAAASKPKIDHFITRFARIYTPVVVAVALGTAIIPSLITGDWYHWTYTALSFLVMSCPCALVLSVPLAFFCGIGSASKRGILFKGGSSLEALKGITTVVMDKTGTVTEGNFVLQQIVPTTDIADKHLLTLAASLEQHSTHPIGVSITAAAQKQNLSLFTPENLEEIPGHGIRARIVNQDVLCGNRRLMERYQVDLSSYQSPTFGAQVLLAVDGIYQGHLVIADTIKPGVENAIATLKQKGLFTAMLTGDQEESARAIAETTGIQQFHARLLPEDKVANLNTIRQQHGPVMFVGDGINDAPVLASANVGAAMGGGADAAIEAADVVYMTSSIEAIPQSFTIARLTNRIALQNVVLALAIKAFVMALGLLGIASMWLAVFADTGVAFLCILNSIRILYKK